MTTYTPDQLCYFARYVLEKESNEAISLQSLMSYLNDWKQNKPNEAKAEPLTVDQQLEKDLALFGNAYYSIDNGIKTRIDPLTLNIISGRR